MAHPVPVFKKVGSEGGSSESGGSESGGSDRFLGGGGSFEYSGWVYHLGVNSIGHEYCHLRYLCIRGKYVEMYKREPHENPGIVRINTTLCLIPLLFVSCNYDYLFELVFKF